VPLFLILAFLGVATGGVLTGFEAAGRAPEPHPRRRRLPAQHPRHEPHPRALAGRPSTPPGTTAIRAFVTAPTAVRASPPPPAPKVTPSVDPRVQGILVGMGFKVPEAKDALAKMPPHLASAPLNEQLKGALALLAK
jgi:hypothetical protein